MELVRCSHDKIVLSVLDKFDYLSYSRQMDRFKFENFYVGMHFGLVGVHSETTFTAIGGGEYMILKC